jgi:hypothetical protein
LTILPPRAAGDQIKIVPHASVQCFTALIMKDTAVALLEQMKKVYGDETARIIVEALLNRATASSLAKPTDALLTRREAAHYVNDELGHPLSFSTLTKLCALGEGPAVARRWGRRPLYERNSLREWVATRGRRP